MLEDVLSHVRLIIISTFILWRRQTKAERSKLPNVTRLVKVAELTFEQKHSNF